MSNNKFYDLIFFVIGASVGATVTMKLLDKKYKKLAEKEIESVAEMYEERKEKQMQKEKSESPIDIPKSEPECKTKKKRMEMEKKVDYKNMAPHVITPDEYGEDGTYDLVSYTYYAEDCILTDENEEIVEDVDDIVGVDSLSHFGEFENDFVYVRNEQLMLDIEILLDPGRYSDSLRNEGD